jgi:DNA-binding transcriptional LysR family regulator
MEHMIADWDDLRVFLALARDGKLTAVARRLGVSHPTVARRVKALEDAIGAKLFDRLPDRFVPTAAGEGLLADVEMMERAAESIDRRSAGLTDTAHGTVRISAGEAMAGFLADHLLDLRGGLQCIEFELVASHLLVNLSRREADLMIREQVPDLASIVARRLGRVAYAVYGAVGMADAVMPADLTGSEREALRRMPWVGFDEEHSYMPGHNWLMDLLAGGRPAVRMNNWLVLRQAAGAGSGLAVLPCYLGDVDPALRRVGPILRDVAVDQWLLVHQDLRALPRVRAVMDALVRLFREHRAAIEGGAVAHHLDGVDRVDQKIHAS